MTTSAMVLGMVPLAAGAEQTASLGRAVIGGLLAATLATLFVLPSAFALVQSGANRRSPSLDPFDTASTWHASSPSESQ
jgi:Cu/Ag efflux pump CusA